MALLKCYTPGCTNSRDDADNSPGKPLMYRCGHCGRTFCSIHAEHGRRGKPCPSCGEAALRTVNW